MNPNLTPEQSHAVQVWASLGTLELIQDQNGKFPQAPSGYAATLFSNEVVKLSGLCAGLAKDLTANRDARQQAAVALENLIDGHSNYLGLTEKATAALLQIATHLRRPI